MADISLHPVAHRPARFAPGLAVALLIAVSATWLGNTPAFAAMGIGSLTLAIIGGMIPGNLLSSAQTRSCEPGLAVAKQILLRAGIVLYGFRLTVQQIAGVGISGVLIDLLTLSSTFMLACWLGQRLLKMDRETTWLIGAGSSICGAAAVLATEPVVKANGEKVAVAIATVVIFGTLAMFAWPPLFPLVQTLIPAITPVQWGIFTGSTLHEVAQVVAAGHAVSAETENAAVIAKMLRVMMLAPFLLLLSGWISRRAPAIGKSQSPLRFPWFALLFIAVALFNSLHLLPGHAVALINTLDNLLLATAMAALGMTTRFSAIKRAGTKPLLLGLALFVWLFVGGGVINLSVSHLLS